MPNVTDQHVTLRQIDKENFVPVVRLEVLDQQKNFVASNVFSIAEAKIYPENTPLAIYAGETLVGFVMYGYWAEAARHYISRLMIAKEFQGKGYGNAAMQLVIARMKEQYGCQEIYISYDPQNNAARQLYKHLGFAATGELEEGEEVACLRLS